MSWGRLSLDDFHRNPSRRWIYYALFIVAWGGALLVLFASIADMGQQRDHVAQIRQLGAVGLASFELYAGGHFKAPTHCATITDRPTLDSLADALVSTQTSISPDRTLPLYEFTAVTIDPAGNRVNFVASVLDFSRAYGEQYKDDIFIEFSYQGPVVGPRYEAWGYPVRLPGMAPWIAETFSNHNCPPKG